MYLIFQPTKLEIRYAAFTDDGELIYDGYQVVSNWNPRSVKQLFTVEILPKLRGHGNVFSTIGIIVPFASAENSEPTLGSEALLTKISSNRLIAERLVPAKTLTALVKAQWPHIALVYLFDTKLSSHLGRRVTIAPFSFELTQKEKIVPYVLQSYAHLANREKSKKKAIISVAIDELTSVVAFDEQEIVDATVSYSPYSAVPGVIGAGAVDVGLVLALVEQKGSRWAQELFCDNSGLFPMTDLPRDLNQLFAIAGVIPGVKSDEADKYSIETIEWAELACRSYLKSIRQLIAATLVTLPHAQEVVINSPLFRGENSVMAPIEAGMPDSLKFSLNDFSPLKAACLDLVKSRGEQKSDA